MTRTFVAVFPPAAITQALAEALARVRRPGDGVAWTKPANLHYTLRFLGDQPEEGIAAATRAATAAAADEAPFALALGETGAFPDVHRPRVLWIGAAAGGERLVRLAARLATALEREGFPSEGRPFVPHLTLGRVREGARAVEVPARLAGGAFPRAAFDVAELVVVGSTLSPGGSIYRPLARAALSPAAP